LEWAGVGVVALHEQLDLLLEFAHAGERVATDGALGDQREPALDLVEPRAVGGREVQMDARVARTMFGDRARVQRCRTHKLRNVLERLAKTEASQTKAVMMAAYKLDPKEGMAKLKKQAQWLEREHADCAGSLLEGLQETFTVNAMGLPPSLTRCLCTTNNHGDGMEPG